LETLSKSIVKIGSLFYGKVDVKISDNKGLPVENVSVSGQIFNSKINFQKNVSGITDSNGEVSLVTKSGVANSSSINACL
jgi:uncharacterized GH25 family protein